MGNIPSKSRFARKSKQTNAIASKVVSKLKKTVAKTRKPKNIITSKNPFPIAMLVKNKYNQVFTLTDNALGVMGSEQVFRLNSLYDPDFTGTGHQPYGFDTLAGIYQNYKVYGAFVTIVFSGANEDECFVAVQVQGHNTTTSLTNLDTTMVSEKPNTKVYTFTTDKKKHIFKTYVPIHKIEGISKLQFKADIESYSALVSTSPAFTPWLRIACGSTRGTGTASITADVTITYVTRFYNRTVLGQS